MDIWTVLIELKKLLKTNRRINLCRRQWRKNTVKLARGKCESI